MSIESVMPSNHLILCRPLLLLPPIPPSIRVLSNESTLYMKWPKYWSFSFSISPSNEHPGLLSFRIDWLDLLTVQGTLESSTTPQFKSINSSALSFGNFPNYLALYPLLFSVSTEIYSCPECTLYFNILSYHWKKPSWIQFPGNH